MNTIEHFRATKKDMGVKVGLMSTLPDAFVLGQAVPNERFRRFCMNMHNTEQAVQRVTRVNQDLGRAWQAHREQDLATHSFDYEPVGEIPKDSVLLLSGGLDSFIAWRLLGQPKAVYFAIGHKAQDKELEKIEAIKEKFGGDITIDRRLDLSDIEMSNGYIPYRNLFFIMLASYHSPNIAFSQILEWAPDKNKDFYHKTEALLGDITQGTFQQLERKKIKVHTPFAGKTKSQLVKKYLEAGLDPADLTEYSVSCYSGEEKNCGQCNACFSRYVAMENNGLHEEYEQTPDGSKFKQRLSFSDFDIKKVSMYVRRYLEMKKYI